MQCVSRTEKAFIQWHFIYMKPFSDNKQCNILPTTKYSESYTYMHIVVKGWKTNKNKIESPKIALYADNKREISKERKKENVGNECI